MSYLTIRKTTVAPVAPTTANTLFIKTHATDASLFELYLSSDTGSSIRRLPNTDDIATMISNALSSSNSAILVADITARDALEGTLTVITPVLVEDASGDPTVTSGAAMYYYLPTKPPGSRWLKFSESESLDVAVVWTAIGGRPTSSPAHIDEAVNWRHQHANKAVIDKFGEDVDGNPTYNGNVIKAGLSEVAW